MAEFSTAPALTPIDCTGDARTRGCMQGELAAERIRLAVRVVRELEAFRLRKPRWVPYGLFERAAARRARRFLAGALSGDWAGFADQLAGISEGAQADYSRVCLLNALEPVMSEIGRHACVPATGACSALAVRGPTAVDGPAIARNFDYLPLVQPLYLLRDVRPSAGLRSLEMTVAPLCGTVDGVNEAGLCITYNYAYAIDAASPAPPISMRISHALSVCRTTAEAVETLTAGSRWGAGLLMVADAAGDLASVELTNTRTAVRRPDGDVLYHSNRFHSSSMQAVQISRDAIHTDAAPTPLRGRRVLHSPETRDARFAELLPVAGPLDADGLQALMSDHGPDGVASSDSICMHSDYWTTTASVQLFPRDRRLRVAFDSTCRAKYAEFAL